MLQNIAIWQVRNICNITCNRNPSISYLVMFWFSPNCVLVHGNETNVSLCPCSTGGRLCTMMYDAVRWHKLCENCGIGPHRLTLAQNDPNLIPPTSSSRLAYDVSDGKPRYFLLVYDDDRRSAAVIQYLCDIKRWHQMTMRYVFYLSATWITKTDQ